MTRKWLQSVDLEVDDHGRPVFESALTALAELIEDGRLKVNASGITLSVDNIDIDVEDITGAAPNSATLFDLKGGLFDVGAQINLVRGPDAENRKSLLDVVGSLAPLTSLAAQITGGENAWTLADVGNQIVRLAEVGRYFLSGGLYAGLGDIYQTLAGSMNAVGGQGCINAVLLGANGTFIGETDYALNTYTKLNLDTYGGALPIAGPGGNSIPVEIRTSAGYPLTVDGSNNLVVRQSDDGGMLRLPAEYTNPVYGDFTFVAENNPLPTGMFGYWPGPISRELIAPLNVEAIGDANYLYTTARLTAMADTGMGTYAPAPLYIGDTGGLRIDCSYSYVNLAAGSDDFAHIPLKCTNDQRLLVQGSNLTAGDDLNLGYTIPLNAPRNSRCCGNPATGRSKR